MSTKNGVPDHLFNIGRWGMIKELYLIEMSENLDDHSVDLLIINYLLQLN